ncbi:MAG: PBECR2 nuclease fold domain-containing protein [Proteobacteria bacterium]|nr:PBECR2 nuclease fold domain-containing protein [Pseudomonadota bacterium]
MTWNTADGCHRHSTKEIVVAETYRPVGSKLFKSSPWVEKQQGQRERFAHFALPTLRRPNEVWSVKYDGGSARNRYIKLFGGSKYDLLVMVKVEPDGSVFWNMMQRDRKGMNALRTGELVFKAL